MGSDLTQPSTPLRKQVSIHAPTWGATLVSDSLDLLGGVSIHAPTWGATIFILSL